MCKGPGVKFPDYHAADLIFILHMLDLLWWVPFRRMIGSGLVLIGSQDCSMRRNRCGKGRGRSWLLRRRTLQSLRWNMVVASLKVALEKGHGK